MLATYGSLRYMEPAATSNLLTQMRRGALPYCVLSLLEKGELYGVEIVRRLAEADGMVHEPRNDLSIALPASPAGTGRDTMAGIGLGSSAALLHPDSRRATGAGHVHG